MRETVCIYKPAHYLPFKLSKNDQLCPKTKPNKYIHQYTVHNGPNNKPEKNVAIDVPVYQQRVRKWPRPSHTSSTPSHPNPIPNPSPPLSPLPNQNQKSKQKQNFII